MKMFRHSARRHWTHAIVGCLLAMIGAVLGPSATAALAASPVAPASDPFYSPPANLASDAPGTILRSREVTVSGPEQADSSAAYQLLFRTTDATGEPVAAVTTVLLPSAPAAGPRRLASYQTAYDSLTLNCAPSYTLQGGNNGGGSTASAETALISQELAQGWDVNVPDYEGLDSEWVVGPMIGHATLDSIRAEEHFALAGLAGTATEVTLNGYSGGSEAATWAAALAPGYAPELRIVGVAAGGNFPDLDYTLSKFDGSLWYGTEIGVMESFSRAYPQLDLKTLLNPAGQALAVQDGQDAGGCGGSTLNEPFGQASQYTNFPSSEAFAADPLVKSTLAKMSLQDAALPTAPLYLYNAIGDELAHIQPVDTLVASYCAKGVTVDYDRDPVGSEHIAGLTRYWPPALQYLEDRFAGDPASTTCTPTSAQPPGSASAPVPPGSSSPPVPAGPSCRPATGRLGSGTLGLARLGMTRARVRQAYRHTTDRRSRYHDVFCVSPAAIRVGVPTAAMLRALPGGARARLRGRVDWILTADPDSSLRGIRPGSTLSATRRAGLGSGYAACRRTWHIVGRGRSIELVELARNTVKQVGIAESVLTRTAALRRRLIATLTC